VWAARRHGAAVAVINGRLSQRSFEGYRRIRPLVSRLLRGIDRIAVQDETYADRFRALGARPEAVQITGSMKYDGAQTDRDNPATRRLAALAGLAADDVVFLAGSTQEPEESVALEVFQQLSRDWPRLRLIIVPRHPERFDSVARMLEASGAAWQRRTLLDPARQGSRHTVCAVRQKPVASEKDLRLGPPGGGQTDPASMAPAARDDSRPRVLLVDVVGELGAWWGTAHVAFVGGSLGNRGGQNMIEPAAYGAAVSFGPNTRNFRDIVAAFLDRDAAVVVADGEQLLAFVRNCLASPAEAAARGERAASLVRQQLGATERTFQLLLPLAGGQQPAVDGDRRAA
jgi:3-deoxy-D-manno-octulosonic-acid transferase